MADLIPAPAPGLYVDVPAAVYRSWDAVNASLLVDLRDHPPQKARYRRSKPTKDTPATALGRMLHMVTLEPHLLLEDRYVVSPRFHRGFRDLESISKAGKDDLYDGGKLEAEIFDAEVEARGQEIIEHDVYTTACAMRDAAARDPAVRALLERPGLREASVVWHDRTHGLPCKLRLDLLTVVYGQPHIYDLKSARSANRKAFGAEIERLGYHIRAAWYQIGMQALDALGGEPPMDRAFAWLVQDKEEPYLCANYYPDPDDLAEGHMECHRLVSLWAQCQKTDTWPGYTFQGQPEVCPRPRWARRTTDAAEDLF